MKRLIAAIVLAAALPLSAQAENLLQVYRDARAYDAQYAAARYALPPAPDDPASLLEPRAQAPAGWLNLGAGFGVPALVTHSGTAPPGGPPNTPNRSTVDWAKIRYAGTFGYSSRDSSS